jgi:hypothetical protein
LATIAAAAGSPLVWADWERSVAKQVAEVIDLVQYRQRKASEATRALIPATSWPMPLGGGLLPFMGPFAVFWMPVWPPVLMDGWSLPERGAGDA